LGVGWREEEIGMRKFLSSYVRILLDGVEVQKCDKIVVNPSVHVLRVETADKAGNPAVRRRRFTLENGVFGFGNMPNAPSTSTAPYALPRF